MRRSEALGMVVIVAACLVFGSVELVYPFGRDQGNYAYAAWAWLDGAAMYRDVFVFKPPGTVFVHALALLLFGHSMTAIRILDIGWTTATALLIAAVARRITGSGAVAVVAGALYPFLYANIDYWSTCQTDGWLNLPTAAALVVTGLGVDALAGDRRGAGTRLLLSAGALVGAGMVFKYTAAAILAPMVVLLAVDRRILARGMIAVAVGAAIPLIGCALWLWGRGAMGAFIDCQLHLVPAYVARTGRASGFDGLRLFVDGLRKKEMMDFVLWTMVVGLGAVALRLRAPENRRGMLVALAWLGAGAAACFAQNKFFKYHYLMMFAPVSVLGAIAAVDVLVRLGRARILAGAAAAIALISPSRFPDGWRALGHIALGSDTLAHHWTSHVFEQPDSSDKDNLALAAYVARSSHPGDTLFLWGFDPMVNFVADRKTVSRFLYDYPFAVSWGNPAYESELLTALNANPPTLFAVASHDATPQVTGTRDDSLKLFNAFDALKAFVAAHYTRETRIARFDVYRRIE